MATITSPATATGTVGIAFTYQITTTATDVTSYTVSGNPPGTHLNATTGLISGTPSDAGSFTMVVGVQPDAISLNVAVTIAPNKTAAVFPAFIPVFPPPNLGSGTPSFPPGHWAPPPLPSFTVPAMVNPASVPPSLAGVVQPQYKTGSATSPTAASWIPQFTTTFPNPPVSIQTTPPPPAMITTTPPVVLDGWAPGIGSHEFGSEPNNGVEETRHSRKRRKS